MNHTDRQFVETVARWRKRNAEVAASELSDLLVVYSVLHTDCIYESAHRTVSLHRTKRGAVEAMKKLKASVFYDEGFYDYHGFKYGKQVIQE